MRDLLLLIFVLGLIPIVFLKPHVGILLWSWIAYMNPHRLSWGFAYDFQFAMVIGVATIAAWLMSSERKMPPGDPVTVLIVLLTIWVSITTLFAVAPEEAYDKWDRTIKILGLTLITIAVVGTRERLHALIWIIVVSVGFYGVKGGLFTLVGGSENRVWGPAESFLADNNALALVVIMVVPLMRYLQLHSAVTWIRFGLLLAIPASLLAVVGSHSRGALLGGAAMLFALAIKSRQRAFIFAVAAAIAVFAFAFTPQRWIERMASIASYEQDESAQGRFDAWKFAYKLALDRPIVGGGFLPQGNEELFFHYVPEAPKVRAFHSVIFEALGEHGWIGLGLFMGTLIAVMVLTRRTEIRARGRPDLLWARDLAAMIQVSIVGYVATGLFQNLAFFDLYYHVLAIAAVAYAIVTKATLTAPAAQYAVHAPTGALGTVHPTARDHQRRPAE